VHHRNYGRICAPRPDYPTSSAPSFMEQNGYLRSQSNVVESSHSNPPAFSIPRIFDIEFRNRMNSALYVYLRRWPTPATFALKLTSVPPRQTPKL
jgi:hypothetical protein